ncbi:protein BRANCHLESS TRICHOME [Syzygium oleosum]|uniref:protein BRANCHLESS TRICHOME n=1 Tax=Syzygium oleosum TaxID=219896 RepID=UPI0024B8C4BF|nr:protein BRANCHLESS TRICHOME [Syzygium oleosum]
MEREEEEEEDQLIMMTIGRSISPEDQDHPTFEPSWKLYENPFFISPHNHQPHNQHHHSSAYHRRHLLHLPLSNSRKIASSSILDLAFLRASMDSELQLLRAQIKDVRSELEHERKARKKVEHVNKKLGKELAEERRGREALERVCEKLAREVSSDKADIDRMKREMEEERKMLRLAEVLREERVQMKLAEARVLLEEKIQELERAGRSTKHGGPSDYEDDRVELVSRKIGRILLFGDRSKSRLVLSEKKSTCIDDNVVDHLTTRDDSSSGHGVASMRETAPGDNCDRGSSVKEPNKAGSISGKACGDHDKIGAVSAAGVGQWRPSPEPENPHIRRGIKGFVEFPRVVRAIGSKSSRHWGTKLECQKAQIRILLKQKSAPAAARSNSLIWS